jgi:hypothetical protein
MDSIIQEQTLIIYMFPKRRRKRTDADRRTRGPNSVYTTNI